VSADREAWSGDLTAAPIGLDPTDYRKAAVRIADQVAGEHPHPLDDIMPRLAGRQLGQDPVIALGVRELLTVLAINDSQANGGRNA
jgi:hypothetical protein